MRILTSILSLILLLNVSFAQTQVAGGIYTNTTWTAALSPYVMVGPVVVFPGATLTIQPGVQILVRDTGVISSTGYNYLEVRGAIKMVGTKSAPIVFEALTQKQQIAAWYGLQIMASQGGQIEADYFKLSNTNYGIFVDNGVLPDSSVYHHCEWSFNNYASNVYNKSYFDSCRFDNNYNGVTGNLLTSSNPWIIINASSFTNNGVGLNPYGSHAVIHHSSLSNNWMAISGIGSVSAWQNTFNTNGIGIRGVSGWVEDCSFTNNTYGITDAFGMRLKNINVSGSNIACNVGSDCILEYSNISNNDTAVVISSGLTFGSVYPMIYQNQICNNTFYHVYNGSNINLNLGTNCFCEPDSAAIDNKLYDGYDDITKGLFNFSIYTQDCSSALRFIKKVEIADDNLGFQSLSDNISVYPNPASDFINIKSPQMPLQVRLFNMLGEEVHCTFSGNRIDLHSQASGSYLLLLRFKDTTVKKNVQIMNGE
jgi:hypothetical protein